MFSNVFPLLLFLLQTAALQINITRLTTNLKTLATHNDLPPPQVQRILYTPSDISARTYLTSLFRSAGLSTKEDPLGNIFATWYPHSPPGVLTGSHFDAIPNSGMYDGTLGILSALEAIIALKESGFVPKRSITILAFTSEEPTRFGLSCIGSRILSGILPPNHLTNLTDINGISFHSARATAGYTGDVNTVPLKKGTYTAFIELHSEQGPILEDTHTQIGAVTSIAAPAAMSVTFTGPGGHAGTTLMHQRKDPSLAAAELSLVVEAAAVKFGTADTVATVGYHSISPNAINSVPTQSKLGIDVRDIDEERRDRILDVVESAAHVIATNRGVGLDVVVNSRDPPAACDDNVVQAVMSVAKEYGLNVRKMISRAYHDALFMARVIPTGMIFLPCRGGISHRPDEFVEQRDIENGVRVLAGVLKRLAGDADADESASDGRSIVEDAGDNVKEILDTVHGADVEDSAFDDADVELESPELAEGERRTTSKSGNGKRNGSHQGRVRESKEPGIAYTAKRKRKKSEEMGNASEDQKSRGPTNGMKDMNSGKEPGKPDAEIGTSVKPKFSNSREPDATAAKVASSENKEDVEEYTEETNNPKVTCTCQASSDVKHSDGEKTDETFNDRKATRSAGHSTSRRMEGTESREPTITESYEDGVGDIRKRRTTESEIEPTEVGTGSFQREDGNTGKPEVSKNEKPTASKSEERLNANRRRRRRRRTKPSQGQGNKFGEKDEV